MKLVAHLPGYFVTGGIAAIVDIGGFALLAPTGLPTPAAASLSFLAAAVVNYLLSARLVFRHPVSARHFGRFLAAALVGLAINVSVTTLLFERGLAPVLAKTGGVGIAFFANYLLVALVVFRRRAPPR